MKTALMHFALTSGALVLRGWVCTTLWLWFATPLVKITPPPLAGMIGLIALIQAFLPIPQPVPRRTPEELTEHQVRVLVEIWATPLAMLILGWIAKQCL